LSLTDDSRYESKAAQAVLRVTAGCQSRVLRTVGRCSKYRGAGRHSEYRGARRRSEYRGAALQVAAVSTAGDSLEYCMPRVAAVSTSGRRISSEWTAACEVWRPCRT
jgi:hypothetical protein